MTPTLESRETGVHLTLRAKMNRIELNRIERNRNFTLMSNTGRPFPYTRSRSSEQLMSLRNNGPSTVDDLPNGGRFTPQQRGFVGCIVAPWTNGTPIWHLLGDERRAIRMFIEHNEEEIRNALAQDYSKLSSRLTDSHWILLCQEWMWSSKMTDKEIEKYRRQERGKNNDGESRTVNQ